MLFGPPGAGQVALGLAVAPLAFVVLLRLPVGVVLAIGIIGGPVVNYLVLPGNAEGIPPHSVALIAFCEFTLLVRMIRSRQTSSLRGVEVLYLATVVFALLVGLVRGGAARVVAAEVVETTNLIALVFILRGLKFDRHDAATFAIAAHLILLPFLLPYLAMSFGERRVDFYLSQLGTLIPFSVWLILNGVLRRGNGAFAASTFLLLVAAFSTSQRGLLMVAIAASAIAIGLYVLRSSPGRAVGMVLVGGLLLTVFLEAVPVLQQIAPGPTERLSEGFGALSYQSRVAEAEDAFAAWEGHLYGLGFGASIPVRAEVEYEITGPRLVYVTSTFIHNSYAWYLAKMGVQGLVAVVLLVGVSSWTAFRRFTKGDHQVEAMGALMLLALSAGGAIGGPALHGFYYTSWVAIAIVLTTTASEPAPRPQTSRRSRWSRSVALDGSRARVV